MPSLDPETGQWEFFGEPEEDCNLIVSISSDRWMTVYHGEGDFELIRIHLRDTAEMLEILELLCGIRPEDIGLDIPLERSPLSSLIESISIGLFDPTHRAVFIPFDRLAQEPKGADLSRIATVQFGKQEPIALFDEWPRLVNGILNMSFRAGQALSHDSNTIIWTHSGELLSARYFLESGHCDQTLPSIGIHLCDQRSKLLFLEHFARSVDGMKLLEAVVGVPAQSSAVLQRTRILYPSERRHEQLQGIAWKGARGRFLSACEDVLNMKEPLRDVVRTYANRTQIVRWAAGEARADIAELMAPLPFFLSWPLRRYRRADVGTLEQYSLASGVLTLLLKAPLFLLLEECGEKGWEDLRSEAMKRFQEKKPSDGDFLSEFRRLRKSIRKHDDREPMVFGKLLELDGEVLNLLESLVTARNRAHHPPNFYRAFLNLFGTKVEEIVAAFRDALEGVTFLATESISREKGCTYVLGRTLMGHDPDFLQGRCRVSDSMEKYEKGGIVAVAGDRSVSLTTLFQGREVPVSSLDVGLFDRVERGNVVYEFVRQSGQGAA